MTQQNLSDALGKMGWSRKKSECAISRFPGNARHTQHRCLEIENGRRASAKPFNSDGRANLRGRWCRWMKQGLIIGRNTPMATAKWGNPSMPHALQSGKRTAGVSGMTALPQGELFAPITFAGSCNPDFFERWLEQSLLPQLQPGNVIFIDYASFHRCHAH